jgi:hypothetical protein
MTAAVAIAGTAFATSSWQMRFAVFDLLLFIRSEESDCSSFQSLRGLSLPMTAAVAIAGTALAAFILGNAVWCF